MKKFLFSFVFLLVFFIGFSQCPTENINLSSQSDIDDFKLNYPNCIEIYRDITINGSNIENLDSLNGIKKINRHLKIINTALSNFNGLDSLTQINGGLTIWRNNNLENLSGIETLVFIGEELEIKSSPILSSMLGLNNVKSIGSLNTLHNTTNGLSIEDSQVSSLQELSSLEYLSGLSLKRNQITSLEGLEGLLKLDGGISIYSELITDLSGLNNITTILNGVYLGSNNELSSLQGLDKLNIVGGSFNIRSNPKLNNLIGLESLTVIHEDSREFSGRLIIEDSEITNLQGLTNLTTVDDLIINGNPNLLNFEGLHSLQLIKNDLEVQRNDNIENLIGLENLNTIGSRLFIFQNIKLFSLNGLSGLLSVGDDLNLSGNTLLSNLSGLSQIHSVGKLEFSYNSNLTSLQGIESLQRIPQSSIRFYNNEKLVDLTALKNATTGEGSLGWGDLYLSGNTSLLSLDGLENLGFNQGQYAIYFYNNTSLNDISAMNNWDAERLNNLTLVNNTSLSTCQVLPICSFLSKNYSNYVDISGNMGDCSSAQDIKSLCDTNPDKDGDGILNENDNCPEKPNPNQEDINFNGIGDVCESIPMVVQLVQTKNISCYGEANAEIMVEVTGGATPYTYELYTSGDILISSGVNNVYSNLLAGVYYVIVTDNNLNQVQSEVTVVTEPAYLASTILVTGMTCSNDNNASVSLEVTGGTSPYEYSIDGGITFSPSNVFRNLGKGTYFSVIRDSNNCTIDQIFEIKEGLQITPEITVTTASCNTADGGISIAINNQEEYLFSIDNDGVLSESQQSSEFKNLSSGSYKVSIFHLSGCQLEQTVVIENENCSQFTLPADNFILEITSETCANKNNGSLLLKAVESLDYTGTLVGVSLNESRDFRTFTNFQDLEAGSYELCIKIASEPDFQKCYTIEVNEPGNLEVDSKINDSDKTVLLSLKGGLRYFIDVNGTEYTTSENRITLPLSKVENNISVKTDLDCQGFFEKTLITAYESVSVFPNPVEKGDVTLLLPSIITDNDILLTVFTQKGVRVIEKMKKRVGRSVKLNMDSLSSGLYTIIITSESQSSMRRIIKR